MEEKLKLSEALEKGYTGKEFDPYSFGECLLGQAYIYATKTAKNRILLKDIVAYWPWLLQNFDVHEIQMDYSKTGFDVMSRFGFWVNEKYSTVQDALKWLRSIGQ